MTTIRQKQLPPGVIPVVLTPFQTDGKIDFPGYGRLLDYYLQNQVSGLFCVCMSSELFELSEEEKLRLASEAVARVEKRVPILASAGIGDTLDEKLASIERIAKTGIDAVVLPASILCGENENDDVLLERYGKIFAAFPEVAFGVYECPAPYHRLIPPETLRRLAVAGNGQLKFIKDTCCHLPTIEKKIAALEGTGLKLYNANLHTLLGSLRAGGAGYSGTSANFYPRLLVELCRCCKTDPARAERLQSIFDLVQPRVDFKYPASAKALIRSAGVDMATACRAPWAKKLDPDDEKQTENFLSFIREWEKEYCK